LPHVINGYYTASSMTHAITGRQINDGSIQQNKLVALLTTLTNCRVGVTDGTFLQRCSFAMSNEMITKMFCGRAPTETVWPGVHNIIVKGEFEKMMSKRLKTKTQMGFLPLELHYWL
jgi:hypothetical protein